MKKYKFHADPGHAWLAVKIDELMKLSIITKISSYSYIKGNTAYLEEDCDAYLFIKAYNEKYNAEINCNYIHIDRRSPIRSYERYTSNRAVDIALVMGNKAKCKKDQK